MASMARTSSDIVISAEPDEILAVIADFAAYPEWATGVRSAEVKSDPDAALLGRKFHVRVIRSAVVSRAQRSAAMISSRLG
jgi:hypothetical protein